MDTIEQIAREKYRLRQRPGHKMPDWEGLSDLMRVELINRESLLVEKIPDPIPAKVQNE